MSPSKKKSIDERLRGLQQPDGSYDGNEDAAFMIVLGMGDNNQAQLQVSVCVSMLFESP